MGDSTKNSAKPEGQLSADDLELIPDSLEDEVSTDEEIWADIDSKEAAAENGKDLADDKLAVDAEAAAGSGDSVEDQLAAGIAGKQPDGDAGTAAPTGQDDKDDQGGGDTQSEADKLWDGANDEQRAAFNAAQTEIEKLSQYKRSNHGRVSTLQRQLTDVTRQFKGAIEAPGGGPGDADAGTAAKGFLASKDWKDFAGEYPEVAGPLGQVITDLQQQVTTGKDRQDASDDDRRLDNVEEQTALLEKEHSDWQDAATDPLFEDWLDDQPRHIREAAVRNAKEIVDAREAADVVGRFKAFRSEQSTDSAGLGKDGEGDEPKPEDQETLTGLSDKRKRQLNSSSGARPRGAGAAHGIPEDGDEEAIWDAYDKQDAREAAAAR